jgi:hypothetical protein
MTSIKHILVLATGLAVGSACIATAGPQRPDYQDDQRYRVYGQLTGTFQLEGSQGDDPRRAAEQAARGAAPGERQRTYQRVLIRLESPEMIAIERRGYSVTMASTHGQQVRFDVDGRDRAERWSGGRTVNTRVTFEGERLFVETRGSRGSDYTVTFDPSGNGRSLVVTRTIYDESLRQPVTVRSFYRRTSDQARWDIVAGDERNLYPPPPPRNEFAVPDGIRLVARLDNDLRTGDAREGDRWTMTAVSPPEYRGAVIQGFVSHANAPGRPPGSAVMTFYLESIRLRGGETYPFDGVIESIRTPDGEAVRVDREGTVEGGYRPDEDRTQETIEHGAIGAALGALIGAVAGGGKGAAIGAAVGAGVGAGTAIVEGRDRFDLPRGTELTFISGDPRYRR